MIPDDKTGTVQHKELARKPVEKQTNDARANLQLLQAQAPLGRRRLVIEGFWLSIRPKQLSEH